MTDDERYEYFLMRAESCHCDNSLLHSEMSARGLSPNYCLYNQAPTDIHLPNTKIAVVGDLLLLLDTSVNKICFLLIRNIL